MKILINCRFIDERYRDSNTLLIDEGRIQCIGYDFESLGCSDSMVEIVDGKGAFVLPGFIDTHTHFLHTGLHLDMVSLFDCGSIDEMLQRLEEGRNDSQWLRGYGFDDSTFKEMRRPSRFDLDRVTGSRPAVIFRRDYHSCVLNTRALSLLEIPHTIDSPEVRDGFFRGMANDWVRQCLFKNIHTTEKRSALRKASEIAVSRGITTVHALEGGSLFGMEDLDFLIEYKDSVPVRIILYPQITDIKWVMERKITRIGGCLLIDGSFGSRTAALSTPYADEGDNSGILYFDDEFLFSFVEKAHLCGLQIAFHAIGDRAIRQIVDIYGKVLLKHPSAEHRHRIEHCELPDQETIDRIAELKLSLAVQPAFELLWGGEGKMYHRRLGAARSRRTNPFREFLDRGILVAGGSDSDVTPMDPLLGIYSAVKHPSREFCLSVQEAIELYTSCAAKIAFEEEESGEIREGNRADLVLLYKNPLEVAEEQIKNMDVKMTFVGGKCVFCNPADNGQ